MGQHLIRGYELPTSTTRSDTTSFSVCRHQPTLSEQEGETHSVPLLHKGYSSYRRPDLLQYRQMLATLDPLGMPLVSATLPGNGADDPKHNDIQKKRSLDSKQAGSNDKLICAIASPTNQNITKARIAQLPYSNSVKISVQEQA